MGNDTNNDFKAINISVLTISDTRSIEQDDSGEYLVSALKEQGHFLSDRKICKDNHMKSEQSSRNGSWMRISMGSSQLVVQGLLEKMERLKPSFLYSIRQLMDLEKCLEVSLIKILKPLHCSREPLQV